MITPEQLEENAPSREHPQLYAEQIRLLYRNAPLGLIATLVNSTVLVFILRSVVSDLRTANPSRSVEVNIAGGLSGYGDASLITIVLTNLLGNAWKFTSKTANARIEFGTLLQDGKSVYYIRDNGAGFDEQYREKMFLPFCRLHSEEEFEGSGIGLAIVRRVIHRHGGDIWAEGTTGQGAMVYFTLSNHEKGD